MKTEPRLMFLIAVTAAMISGCRAEPGDKLVDDPQAVAALAKAGVPLERDSLGRVRWIEAAHGELSDDTMRYLPGLSSLEWLEVGGGRVTATGSSSLKGCPSIRRLYLHDIPLTDDALRFLPGLTKLEALTLQHTGITGKGLGHLAAGAALIVLNLSDNEIDDQAMERIARLSGLEVLALQNTRITGVGLEKLKGMARLNVLNLVNCRIEDSDLQWFTSMPNLRIVHAAGCSLSEKAVGEFGEKLPMLSIFR